MTLDQATLALSRQGRLDINDLHPPRALPLLTRALLRRQTETLGTLLGGGTGEDGGMSLPHNPLYKRGHGVTSDPSSVGMALPKIRDECRT